MARHDPSYNLGRSSFYTTPYREYSVNLPAQVSSSGHIRLLWVSGSADSSINMISDDFIHGFRHEGRMSAVRRFFCLFVTFDVLFIGFLWIISIVVNGERLPFSSNCSLKSLSDHRRRHLQSHPDPNSALHNLHVPV